MMREPESIQDEKRDAGVGELRLRAPAECELLTTPAPVDMLDLKKMGKGLLNPAVLRVAEATENPGGAGGIAGIERSAGGKAIAAILAPCGEDELKGALHRLVLAIHPKFVEGQQRLERAERAAYRESSVGTGPVVATVGVALGQHGLDIS